MGEWSRVGDSFVSVPLVIVGALTMLAIVGLLMKLGDQWASEREEDGN